MAADRARRSPVDDELALGTIDSWLIWNLTGGAVHATDPTNASRTMLFDIRTLRVVTGSLRPVRHPDRRRCPTSCRRAAGSASTSGDGGCPPASRSRGVAGDQQAALFGQACFTPGMAKNTYGTGSFVLLNVGSTCPPPTEGMLTTVAWKLADGTVAYALEGAIFVTGAAVQWMRDGLGLIQSASEIGPLAESVPDNGGVYLVPAFAGLGSPWWDPLRPWHGRRHHPGHVEGAHRPRRGRGHGLSDPRCGRGDGAASGRPPRLRVDGGAAVMDVLLQMQADQLGVTVQRPIDQETTALGAAYLAALAEGVWPSLAAIDELGDRRHLPPEADRTPPTAHAAWLREPSSGREPGRAERSRRANERDGPRPHGPSGRLGKGAVDAVGGVGGVGRLHLAVLLAGERPHQHLLGRPEEQDDVQRRRPVLDVEQIEVPVGVERRVVPSLDLPQPGDARADARGGRAAPSSNSATS